MTREEQIEKEWVKFAVKSNYRYDEKSFKEAIKWADKTMIDKACEWIKNNKSNHLVWCFGSLFTDWDKFIREFRKTMEE